MSRRRQDADLEDEIQGHLNMAIRDRMERGESAQQAETNARRELGNKGLVKEITRDTWGWTSLERFWQDLRYGFRIMGRSPGFTAVAVLSLALGIGANTAIFSVIDALLLKSLPVRSPEQLVTLGYDVEPGPGFFAYPGFEKFRTLTQVFSDMTAVSQIDRSNVVIDGSGGGQDAGTVRIGLVSGTYFSTLGVNAAVGRTLDSADDRVPGGHPVAVIAYNYWERRFARSSDVVGRTFTLNGTSYSILGVTPAGFSGDWVGRPVDIWIPLAMQSQVMQERPNLLANPNPPWLRIIARLRPNVSIKTALAAAQVVYPQTILIMRNLTPHMQEENLRARLKIEPSDKGFSPQRETFAPPLAILMTVVGLVLLIACANIANLLLARANARQKEIAVRLSLGAGRMRIVRQLLTESILLAMMGGALGLLFASWGARALLTMAAAGPISVYLDVHPDARVFGFTAALCLLTGALFGVAPAFRASRTSLTPALKAACGRSGPTGHFGLGKILVVSQVALSLLLLIGAGLFVRTLRNLKTQDVGFDREKVLLVWSAPSHVGYTGQRLAKLFESVQARLSALPGVVSASPSSFGLLGDTRGRSPVKVQGYTYKPDEDSGVQWNLLSPGYFSTVGMRLQLGRDFTARDTETSPRVAIVNETMARYYFGGQNPVGKHFGIRRDTGSEIEIVGVVQDARYNTLRDKDLRMMYFPYRQDVAHIYDMALAVRTAGNSLGLPSRIRDELRSIDRSLPILKIDTMEEQLNDSLAQERLVAALSGFFGALAVLLACIGLYGVMSYTAVRRTNEIGIRLALGATRAGVRAMVLREVLLLVGIGIAIGVPATLATTHYISSLLFGVSAADPLTIVIAALLMTAVAALAGFLPALRASRVAPMVALRYE
jgi:predicted permease